MSFLPLSQSASAALPRLVLPLVPLATLLQVCCCATVFPLASKVRLQHCVQRLRGRRQRLRSQHSFALARRRPDHPAALPIAPSGQRMGNRACRLPFLAAHVGVVRVPIPARQRPPPPRRVGRHCLGIADERRRVGVVLRRLDERLGRLLPSDEVSRADKVNERGARENDVVMLVRREELDGWAGTEALRRRQWRESRPVAEN